MTAPVRKADFEKLDGSTFVVHLDDQTMDLKLKDVATIERSPQGHESFSLVFDGPKEPMLSQGLYKVTNDQMGETAIFLVPVAGDDTGIDYEAVYNIKLEDG